MHELAKRAIATAIKFESAELTLIAIWGKEKTELEWPKLMARFQGFPGGADEFLKHEIRRALQDIASHA